MSGKRKREEDDLDFTPPSAKTPKQLKEEMTRSGRARKKPARFKDEVTDDDIDKIDSDPGENEDETPVVAKKVIKKAPSTPPAAQTKLLLQNLQAAPQTPVAVIPQGKVQQPIQLQIPGTQVLQTVATPQIQTVISPGGQQLKIVTQIPPQIQQQVVHQTVPQVVMTTPPTPTDISEAGKRGRVRKKSAKVLEMEEFEEAEKTKPKKAIGKQQSPGGVTSPLVQSPVKQVPPDIPVKNEQIQNIVLSMAGGVPTIVKNEIPPMPPAKKPRGKAKVKDLLSTDVSLVKEEPKEVVTSIIPPPPPPSSKGKKQVKTEPVMPIAQMLQETSPPPAKKGKSVIKMLLNTPTQFTTPAVTTPNISPVKDSPPKTQINIDPSHSTPLNVKKILMSPADLDESHISSDDDEDDEDFDDDDDDFDDGDDEDDMEWQFESLDGKTLTSDDLVKKVSPADSKKGKKRATKKKPSQDGDDFDDEDSGDDDDDTCNLDEDDDEGNLVIADEVKKKKPTKKSAPKKKGDSTKTPGKDKPPKEKKKKRLTAYTLWCNSMRNKVLTDSPGIDFASLSKRLGEIWQGLPSRDKMSWKRKAKKEARKLLGKGQIISTGKKATIPAAAATVPPPVTQPKSSALPRVPPPIHHPMITPAKQRAAAAAAAAAKQQDDHSGLLRVNLNPHSSQGSGIEPIDVSAYLKLVGESLSIIGMRLQEHRGLIAVQGSLSVLLDSLLCAVGPLMCLTTQIPELHGCPAETHNRTLDNLAYFMPGL